MPFMRSLVSSERIVRRNLQAGGDGGSARVARHADHARAAHDGIDHGLALHRAATSAYTHLLEELLEERTSNMNLARKAWANAALTRSTVARRAREAALRAQIVEMQQHATLSDQPFSMLLSSI